MFGKANLSLLPDLQQVGVHTLSTRTPSFSGFAFETIGKQPSLLARISDKRADDPEVSSPSPLYGADYIALPPDSDIDDLAPSVPLDRKSLLQALTNADDAVHSMDVDGDRESHHLRDPTIPDILPQDIHPSEGIPASVAPTPQLPEHSTSSRKSSFTSHCSHPSFDFLDQAAARSPVSTTFSLAYPESEHPDATQSPSTESTEMSIEHEASVPPLAPASITVTPNTAPSGDDARAIEKVDTQEHPEAVGMITLYKHVLDAISTITAKSSTPKADDFEKVIAAFQAVQTQSVSAISAARRARLLAEQSCDLAKQALVAAEESLDAAEISNRRYLEVSETLDIRGLQESNRKKSTELEVLKTDISSLGDRLQIYASKMQSKLASATATPPNSAHVELAVSPFHAVEKDDASKVKSIISRRQSVVVEGKQQKTQKVTRVHDVPAPEVEADVARRAWEAERELSARRSLPPAETSNPSRIPADLREGDQLRTVFINRSAESFTEPQPRRRSDCDIILTEKVQYRPEMARGLPGDRRQVEKKTAEEIEQIASLTTLTLPAPSTTTPVGPAPRFGNPVANQTLLSFSPPRSNIMKSSSIPPVPSRSSLNRSTLSAPAAETNSSFSTSRPNPTFTTGAGGVTRDPRERPQAVAKEPKDLSNAAPQVSNMQVESEGDDLPSSTLPPKPAASPTSVTINLLPNLSALSPGGIVRDHAYPSEETDSPMLLLSPLVYCTRQSPEEGNMPYEPIDTPLSANSQICITKHLLERQGVQWHTKLGEIPKAEEEFSSEQLTASVSGSDSQRPLDSTTPQVLSIVIPTVPAVKHQAAMTPNRSEADRVSYTPNDKSSQASPPLASSAAVGASSQDFRINGDSNKMRTPTAAPRNLTPAPAQSPSEYTPVSASQKRKLDEKEPPSFSAKPKSFRGKRSRPDDSRTVPQGDHWSPGRSLPPSPSRKTFAQRIGRTADCYRPQYNDGNERIYNHASTPPYSPWKERRLDDDSREPLPDLALRLSEPISQRGRGKQRGGAVAGPYRGGRRGTVEPPRARLGSGGLESRISDPQTSLGDRIGS
ncbi:hypothetical protein BDN71DRAFT_1591988 [Pleurotus eryngii]|uniref:Uncharacterized protein n=1 Tax=Pleurotus eryngii TaxID=5323 RepID=A0A9P5ZPK1_PLEER|nr:hypothetical protein BDN71DRAFT_1591988 [Pleurotus eryngii]